MRIAVVKESRPGERRVGATPESVGKLVALGAEMTVETGAGATAAAIDDMYQAAGAAIVDAAEAWGAEMILKVRPPTADEARRIARGAILVSFLYPDDEPEAFAALAERGVTALAMEAIPRIARAQKMDALSSMANIAGYRAVIDAAAAYGRFFPLLMTAAGTVAPAQVLVIGAGVAGLSAIATARRLGAVVRAFDPRPAVAEQVESLGARFLDLDLPPGAETGGGYAAAQPEEFLRLERELLAKHLAETDIVISAALVRGARAPVLLTAEMARDMRPGSVIVDLAADQGGNCASTRPDEVVVENGVTILGFTNFASRVPIHASQLYARNVLNLVTALWSKEADRAVVDPEDEIAGATAILLDGEDRRSTTAAMARPAPAGQEAR